MIVVLSDHTHLLILVRPSFPMLHTNSHGHWLSDFGEDDFKGSLPNMGVGVILVMSV